MFQIHPNARTTPAVRAAIATSQEPTGVLAKRYGVSTETIRKWRKRGADDCQDRSARPQRLRWRASEEERAIVCELRRMTGFALDDLTFTLRHFLPHLNRDSIYRILKAEGLGRLPPPSSRPLQKEAKTFKAYDLGFLHIDIKHLPKLQVIGSGPRKRYLYVAIDRTSRMVHLAVKDEETEVCATAFLKEAVAAFPFKVTHVLTDNGSCFTADDFETACRGLGIEHRRTRPDTPKTNGMVERFNGRIGREVLVMCIGTHGDLERLLQGYKLADNARRQRVLNGRSPDEAVGQRLKEKPGLANPAYRLPEARDLANIKAATTWRRLPARVERPTIAATQEGTRRVRPVNPGPDGPRAPGSLGSPWRRWPGLRWRPAHRRERDRRSSNHQPYVLIAQPTRSQQRSAIKQLGRVCKL